MGRDLRQNAGRAPATTATRNKPSMLKDYRSTAGIDVVVIVVVVVDVVVVDVIVDVVDVIVVIVIVAVVVFVGSLTNWGLRRKSR